MPLVQVSHGDRARFWKKVDTDGPVPSHVPELGPCWVWTCSTRDNGYGQFTFGSGGTSSFEVHRSHRVAWVIQFGPIPEGMCVLHRCDNPPCVRPDHLFLGTVKDNYHDMKEKGRLNLPEGLNHWKHNKPGANKMTEEKVTELRQLRATGVTYQELADRYGITLQSARDIAIGRTWKHVSHISLPPVVHHEKNVNALAEDADEGLDEST